MEEPCRSRKFHFPGYDGTLPKAMRTSRKRSPYHKKASGNSMDLNCIELLATVAGQVLQSKRSREESLGTAERTIANEIVRLDGRATCEVKASCVKCQQLGTPGKALVENISHSQDSSNMRRVLDKMVGASCLEGAGSPLNLVWLQNAKSVLANANEANARSLFSGEEASISEAHLMSKGDASVHVSIPDSPLPGQVYKKSHFEEGNADDDLKEEGSCMTLAGDESPQPRSSSSIDEVPTLVNSQSYGLCCEHPVETHLDFSQDLDRLEAKDDDDKFSALVVPVATLPAKHSLPFLENSQHLMQGEEKMEVYEKEALGTEAKTEGIANDGINGKQSHLQFSSQKAQGRKRRRISKSFKLPIDPCKSSNLGPIDTDAMDTSVGSSPTTSKGSWRNVRRKSNGSVDCSPIKLNITSFRVPELSIDLPETATVANLKRAVMEAAVNLLGGGLHVRVLHQGKRVQDENSTLVQMGIACKDRGDSLAFMLEPSGVPNTSLSIAEKVFACTKGRSQHASWHPVFTLGDDLKRNRKETGDSQSKADGEIDAAICDAQAKNVVVDSGECVMLQQCIPFESPPQATAALIVHPDAEGCEPSALLTSQENFVSFTGKRRTRRPFTVMEVEALVKAVEFLGTGRWREVKQQVFSHARHRTYVDLKDKWKTLVHTARIAPHQRRGEPVPQELLDRVLQAHTYWALQVAKQQEDMGI